MTDSRQRDDRTVERGKRRRIVACAAALALVAPTVFLARTLGESAEQLLATFQGLAPRAGAVLDRTPPTPFIAPPVAVTRPPSTAAANEPAPLQTEDEPAVEPEIGDEPALTGSGPPSAAEFAQLIDSGLVPEATAEDADALRAALEAAAP